MWRISTPCRSVDAGVLIFWGRLHVPCGLPRHSSTVAGGGDAVVGASLCIPTGYPKERGGTRAALLHGGVWAASRAKVTGGKAVAVGGWAPNSWRSAVHTHLISPGHVCAAGSQPPRWGGRTASTRRSPPAPVPFIPACQGGISKLFCVLL